MTTKVNKAQFLQAAKHQNLKTIELDLTEFGEEYGTVTLREMTVSQAVDIGKTVRADNSEAAIEWVKRTLIDPETGELMIQTKEDEDILRGMSARVLIRMSQAAMELNDLGDGDETTKN